MLKAAAAMDNMAAAEVAPFTYTVCWTQDRTMTSGLTAFQVRHIGSGCKLRRLAEDITDDKGEL